MTYLFPSKGNSHQKCSVKMACWNFPPFMCRKCPFIESLKFNDFPSYRGKSDDQSLIIRGYILMLKTPSPIALFISSVQLSHSTVLTLPELDKRNSSCGKTGKHRAFRPKICQNPSVKLRISMCDSTYFSRVIPSPNAQKIRLDLSRDFS